MASGLTKLLDDEVRKDWYLRRAASPPLSVALDAGRCAAPSDGEYPFAQLRLAFPGACSSAYSSCLSRCDPLQPGTELYNPRRAPVAHDEV